MKFIKHLLKRYQFLRFFMIGGIAALTDIILLYIFTEYFGIYYLLSSVLSFMIVTTGAFFSHKKFTFACSRVDIIKQLLMFFAVNIGGLLLYITILYIGSDIFGYYYISVAVIDKFIVLGWNYGLNKFITFRHVGH